MIITFDFGQGVVRKFHCDEALNNILDDGGKLTIQVCHPKFAEYCHIDGIVEVKDDG